MWEREKYADDLGIRIQKRRHTPDWKYIENPKWIHGTEYRIHPDDEKLYSDSCYKVGSWVTHPTWGHQWYKIVNITDKFKCVVNNHGMNHPLNLTELHKFDMFPPEIIPLVVPQKQIRYLNREGESNVGA